MEKYKFSIFNHTFDVALRLLFVVSVAIIKILDHANIESEFIRDIGPVAPLLLIMVLPFFVISIQYFLLDYNKNVEINHGENYLVVRKRNKTVKIYLNDIQKVEAHGNMFNSMHISANLFYRLIYTKEQGVFFVSSYVLPEQIYLHDILVLHPFPFVSSKLENYIKF